MNEMKHLDVEISESRWIIVKVVILKQFATSGDQAFVVCANLFTTSAQGRSLCKTYFVNILLKHVVH